MLEATGAGNANPGVCAAVQELTAAGVVVVTSTRVAAGPVAAIYGDGGGVDLRAAGAVPSGLLRPSQARMLLAALLGSHRDPDVVRVAFAGHAAADLRRLRSHAPPPCRPRRRCGGSPPTSPPPFPGSTSWSTTSGASGTPGTSPPDGLEHMLALNHLAPFLLTHLLVDRLMECAPARVVTVSSDAQRLGRIDFADLQGERSWSGQRAYNQSTLMKSPEQGALTPIHLASAPEVEGVTGRFFANRKPRRSSKHSYDEADALRLWEVSAELVGLDADTAGRLARPG